MSGPTGGPQGGTESTGPAPTATSADGDADALGASFGVPSGIRRVFAPAAGATRIVLVRHGEAVCNVNGIVGGVRGCTGLTEFHRRWGDQVTSRSSVLLLGDARNNYHASASWVIEDIQRKARHVYWLNPEPRDYWGSGDSIVGEYAAHCDEVVECRTLRQLEHFVGNLA